QRAHDRRARPRARRHPARRRTGVAPRERAGAGGDQEGGRRHRGRDEGAGPVHVDATAPTEECAASVGRGGRRRRGARLHHGRQCAAIRRWWSHPRAIPSHGGRVASIRVAGATLRAMIVQVAGVLITKELDRVEIMTDGGVAYELAVPLSAYEALPKAGERTALHS